MREKLFLVVLSVFVTSLSYSAEKTISFKSGNLTLSGSLITPDGKKGLRSSCVLLLPGSGPTDRDGNQPSLQSDFIKQIAQYLGSNGIASLRFDKRAVKTYQMFWPVEPDSLTEFFSWTSFRKDIAAAFNELKKAEGTNPKSCSILGHSEGGVFALDVASELKPATLILMGTPGRPLNEVLKDQISSLLDQQKTTPEQKKYYMLELSRIMGEIQRTGVIPKDIPEGLKAIFPPGADRFLQTDLSLDPAKKISAFTGPILILNGTEDKQVNPTLDAETLYRHGQKRPNVLTKIKLFDGLGHEFNKSTSVAGSDHAISHDVLEALIAWFDTKESVHSKSGK